MEERSILQPRKEELKFLQLRTKLKEISRKKMNPPPDQAVKIDHSFSYDHDYGSFFGPSQPSVAPRLLKESSLLQLQNIPHITLARISNISNHSTSTARKISRGNGSKPPAAAGHKPVESSIFIGSRKKAQMLRLMRDYSFLSSGNDADQLPARPDQTVSVSFKNVEAPSAQVPSKIMTKSSLPHHSRRTKEERKLAISCKQKQQILGTAKSASASQPAVNIKPKGFPVAIQGPKEKNKTAVNAKISCIDRSSSLNNNGRANNTRLTPPPAANSSKQNQKRTLPLPVTRPARESFSISKRPPNHVQHLNKQPKAQIKSSGPAASSQLRPPKRKRPTDHVIIRHHEEEDNSRTARAISIIREMFGYDPNKYDDSDDDDDMEVATFGDIQREERRSARIARTEDQEELRKIVAEERRDRLGKDSAKKRKLTQT